MARNRSHRGENRSRQNVRSAAFTPRTIIFWGAALGLIGCAVGVAVFQALRTARPSSQHASNTPRQARPASPDAQTGRKKANAVPAKLVAEQHLAESSATLNNPLNAQRAYGYLQQICAIGPRPSGSHGMLEQMRLLRKHFAGLGGHVSFQQFIARNPLGGPRVRLTNTIVQWHPEKKDRILLCAHYDTRPLPDRDPNPVLRREGRFIGANDGASGVAVLMELAHLMPQLAELPIGVDFVFFDGEELVYDDRRDPYFLGSTWFAQQYIKEPPPHKYQWGVLLDMVGDADLQIYQEQFSASWRDTKPLVAQIWGMAQRLGVKEFVAQAKYEVRDDHLPLRNIAKIPACDIIDFDYPAWHTTEDVPERCSGESLAKVGWVVYEWLKSTGMRAESEQPRAGGS